MSSSLFSLKTLTADPVRSQVAQPVMCGRSLSTKASRSSSSSAFAPPATITQTISASWEAKPPAASMALRKARTSSVRMTSRATLRTSGMRTPRRSVTPGWRLSPKALQAGSARVERRSWSSSGVMVSGFRSKSNGRLLKKPPRRKRRERLHGGSGRRTRMRPVIESSYLAALAAASPAMRPKTMMSV